MPALPGVIRPLLDAFEAAHPGIKVEYRQEQLTDYRERLVTAAGSGQGPDVFTFRPSWTPRVAGIAAPITAAVFTAAGLD
jgi:ABC-type glycerol-3-phosphate transport system substrate-binding protein